jgi:RNA-directed DNA polymerase
VNRFTAGWVTYYRDAGCRTTLRQIDQWLRRKLRCVRLKHCKNPKTIATFLREHGVRDKPARQLASSGKGWWRLASTEQAKRAMPNAWFDELGLVGMEQRHVCVEPYRKPPWYVTRMPGGVRGGAARPYSISPGSAP